MAHPYLSFGTLKCEIGHMVMEILTVDKNCDKQTNKQTNAIFNIDIQHTKPKTHILLWKCVVSLLQNMAISFTDIVWNISIPLFLPIYSTLYYVDSYVKYFQYPYTPILLI